MAKIALVLSLVVAAISQTPSPKPTPKIVVLHVTGAVTAKAVKPPMGQPPVTAVAAHESPVTREVLDAAAKATSRKNLVAKKSGVNALLTPAKPNEPRANLVANCAAVFQEDEIFFVDGSNCNYEGTGLEVNFQAAAAGVFLVTFDTTPTNFTENWTITSNSGVSQTIATPSPGGDVIIPIAVVVDSPGQQSLTLARQPISNWTTWGVFSVHVVETAETDTGN